MIAWTVVILAARFLSQQSVAAGGPRFAVIWLPALMVLYLRELLSQNPPPLIPAARSAGPAPARTRYPVGKKKSTMDTQSADKHLPKG